MNCDVLIIGGGLAGATAALAARERGARTALIDHAPGATAMHSGMFDIDVSPARLQQLDAPENPGISENIHETIRANPHHPWAALPRPADAVRDAVRFVTLALYDVGLNLSGGQGYMLLSNNLGTLRRARLSLASMAGGDVSAMARARLLVAAPAGLDSFHAPHAAASIKALADSVDPDYIRESRGATIDIPLGRATANLSPFTFAAWMDRINFMNAWIDSVAALVEKHKPTHVAFPAILGVNETDEIIKITNRRLGVSCFELASAPPSVPGMRLSNALARTLKKARIRVISGRATGFTVKKDRIAAITVHAPHEEINVTAAAVALATGKFLSGGLSRDERLQENLFDLPVYYKGKAAADTFMYDLATPKIHDPQPIFSCGLRTDAAMKPVDESGRAVWPNLFAAGSILAGFDPFHDRCGAGVAVSTGCEAGKNAAQCAAGKEIEK